MEKTLLVTIDFPPKFGGVATYWANLDRYLSQDDFIVLAPEYDDTRSFDIRQDHLIYRKNLISRKKWLWPKWLPLFYYMYRLIKTEKIKKVIVGQVLPVGTAAYLLQKILNFDYIVSVHGMDIKISKSGSRKHGIMKKVLKRAEKIIANSNFTKGEVEKLGVPADKITIIYPCPNIKKQEVDPMLYEDIVKEYGLEGKKIILTVGRLVERKGHDRVIQSLPHVIKRFPNTRYLIIGRGNNISNLKCLVDRLNLKKYVLFLDNVDNDELQIFYGLADVFIMTTRELSSGDVEGFGIVYLEANNFKKPVIAGRTGGVVESVEDEVNGLLVNPDNFCEIYRSILRIFKDKEFARKLGERGYERNQKYFCWDIQAQKLKGLLD